MLQPHFTTTTVNKSSYYCCTDNCRNSIPPATVALGCFRRRSSKHFWKYEHKRTEETERKENPKGCNELYWSQCGVATYWYYSCCTVLYFCNKRRHETFCKGSDREGGSSALIAPELATAALGHLWRPSWTHLAQNEDRALANPTNYERLKNWHNKMFNQPWGIDTVVLVLVAVCCCVGKYFDCYVQVTK